MQSESNELTCVRATTLGNDLHYHRDWPLFFFLANALRLNFVMQINASFAGQTFQSRWIVANDDLSGRESDIDLMSANSMVTYARMTQLTVGSRCIELIHTLRCAFV